MNTLLQDMLYHPAPIIAEISDFLADPVSAADFPQTLLRFRNDRAAVEIGLSGLSDNEWCAHFGRFVPLPDNLPQPLALRYHGHQFRNYNPDIGDGRGFLFAQLRDVNGRLMDLGTKGSGQTPYSRFGDGRLTLKGAVREILATEMLEALGVSTSRTLSVIETGEQLHRGDEPSPTRSAVLVRLSHGHIRIGSFQRLAEIGDLDSLKRLTQYCLKHYFNEDRGEDAAVRLLTLVVERTAHLAASYMAAGFVHGVLNTDNINISGESFDYGPWRWTPFFDGGFTAAYFDESGLYAFGRQAEAIHWNVVQLAISLSKIADQDHLIEAINQFAGHYQDAIIERMLWRLGVIPKDRAQNAAVIRELEASLSQPNIKIDQFFFDWAGGKPRTEATKTLYTGDIFKPLSDALKDYRPSRPHDDSYWRKEAPCTMYIEDVEAIWAPIAESDDWSVLNTKIADIREQGIALKRTA